MGPTGAATRARAYGGGVRELRRLETRARLFEAALTEIGRSGVAGADVSAIAAAAGVVRGTFYFHFPTKEHVLVELERSEEARIVAELAESQDDSDDLVCLLTTLVLRIAATERQLGRVVFRDMLGLHFSATRPVEDELTEHPLADFVAAAITNAQNAGRVPAQRDAGELTVFFLTGLFALLATGAHDPAADAILARYVTTIVKGMESR
ncbi:TetR/AcrR family transcriptional regulator [Mycobacterium asiaticum]|uniref:TetR family transcriptional regulator n=1 Tax=Mycobacterium asiaticum TaxID=1790 RepID=A0A1A3KZD5_MYCAS|nr:TetR/AcrR family transcriptional regulator [Mycobacterium asiaticum]OBJ89804.1 TetR family transcriptional regulator [Mycobacterium asiaticum]